MRRDGRSRRERTDARSEQFRPVVLDDPRYVGAPVDAADDESDDLVEPGRHQEDTVLRGEMGSVPTPTGSSLTWSCAVRRRSCLRARTTTISESMIMVSPSMTDRGRIGLCMRKT
jgi:hypothetical protein